MATVDDVLNAAQSRLEAGDFPVAESLLHKVLQFDPNQPRALILTVHYANLTGMRHLTIPPLDRLIALSPGDINLREMRADARFATRDVVKAVQDWVTVLRHVPDRQSSWLGLAQVGGTDRFCRLAVALMPDFAEAWTALFRHAMDGRDFKTGTRAASYAAALKNVVVTLGNLGVVAEHLDVMDKAAHLHTAAIALAPNTAVLYANAASTAKIDGHLDRTLRLSERGQLLAPTDPMHMANVASAKLSRGDSQEACRLWDEALRLSPGDPTWTGNLAFAWTYRADVSLADRDGAIRSLMAPFNRPYRRMIPAEPSVDRCLRVTYVSADLRNHPVGRNVAPLFENHDRTRIEPHVINVGGMETGLSHRIKAQAASWHNLSYKRPDQVAAAVCALDTDILVVLAGHTGENMATLLAQRLAPVQMSFHDVASSHLNNADYWVTDRVLHPDRHPHDTTESFSEALLRLPCFYLHETPPPMPIQPVPEGPPVFVSFNAIQKLSVDTLALWSRVLQAVPDARLHLRYREMLAERGVRADMTNRLVAAGIDPERVTLGAERLSLQEHLSRLGGMTLALDPFPFNGSTTTFEALWMGVPVVSLAGESFVGRVGACFLKAIGHPELLVSTPDDYVSTVQSLAQDRTKLTSYREGLREALLASPVMDAKTYTQALEEGYRAAWRKACAGDVPSLIDIGAVSPS